ncbi:hypothetical protein AB0911_38815, partial [Streptomyces nigra]
MTSPIPTDQQEQQGQQRRRKRGQMNNAPWQTSWPGEAPRAGVADPAALPPDADHNAQALAVFFKVQGAHTLGHVTEEGGLNNFTGLPNRGVQVLLARTPPRTVKLGERIADLMEKSHSSVVSPHEELILTSMGFPIENGKIITRKTRERQRERNADALRVVYGTKFGIDDWKSLGEVKIGGHDDVSGLPSNNTVVELKWDDVPVNIGQRIKNLMNDSSNAKASVGEEEVLRTMRHTITDKRKISRAYPGAINTVAPLHAHPEATASGTLYGQYTRVPAGMAQAGQTAPPYPPGMAAGPSHTPAAPWTQQRQPAHSTAAPVPDIPTRANNGPRPLEHTIAAAAA